MTEPELCWRCCLLLAEDDGLCYRCRVADAVDALVDEIKKTPPVPWLLDRLDAMLDRAAMWTIRQ